MFYPILSLQPWLPIKSLDGHGSAWIVFLPDLGGGNSNIFYFHPYLGKIPILTNIFQRG